MRLLDRLEEGRASSVLRDPGVQLQMHALIQHAVGLHSEHVHAAGQFLQLEALARGRKHGKPQRSLHFERFRMYVMPLHILS